MVIDLLRHYICLLISIFSSKANDARGLIFWTLMSLLWCAPIMAQVVVEANINQNQGMANYPIYGSLTITHPRDKKVDEKSFTMDNDSLSTTLVRQVPIAEDVVISIYSFELPGREKGLYMLSPISVKVGNERFESFPSSYEIKALSSPIPSAARPASAPANPAILFKLDAFVEGPSPLYPGQRAKLIYRISFNRSIDLTHSELPLVHTTEFKKVGDEQVKDYQQGDVTVQEIVQEVEASKPGTFHYGPSTIEGYAYQTSFGKKQYVSNKLKAEAPAVDIVVNELPRQLAPLSFTGAIGPIQGDLKMLTPSIIQLGDRIELELTVNGPVNLAEMALPELKCQPGFSGFFQFSDLPPTANLKGPNKIFRIEMRPISTFVQSIPSIELSSFEPTQGKYTFWQSAPIPLNLSPPPLEKPVPSLPKPLNLEEQFPSLIQRINIPLAPLNQPEPITLGNPGTSWLNTWWVLWVLPLGGALLLLQKQWHKQWRESQPPIKASKQKIQAALSASDLSSDLLTLLSDALICRLKEVGYWTDFSQIDELSQEGLIGEVRAFLLYLDSLRYGKNQSFSPGHLKQETQKLYELLTLEPV